MPSTTAIAYVGFALLIVRGLVPARFRAWAMRAAVLVWGLFIFADTPTIPWPVKLATWLALILALVWRERRERDLATADSAA